MSFTLILAVVYAVLIGLTVAALAKDRRALGAVVVITAVLLYT